ncbi:MBL fold metallo-hydrolase [Streptacidiphilus anmyonensis]|uniref:MBL fold metallo-hydrolase n=1 Tax=Streptacidiphilus anmyonensis TaxID=405782 RepID=UPI0005AA12EF|nr:MBL fold metallo-hydrolase [Streptacidiphilus anmyonensis]
MLRPAAPQRSQLALGTTTITYLPDGFATLDPGTFFPGADWSAHPGHIHDGSLVLSFGSFLIRMPDRNILVDLAVGNADTDLPGVGHMQGGLLLDNLAGERLSRDDIDTVVYTHLHQDHVRWTTDASPFASTPRTPTDLTFRRARHLVSEREWQHWSDPSTTGGPDRDLILEPLTGAIEFVQDGNTIAPGVDVLSLPGHTPGHIGITVRDPASSAPQSVLIVCDVLHSTAQISDPALAFATDTDRAQARAAREHVLAHPASVIAAGHFTGAVFGRVTGERPL